MASVTPSTSSAASTPPTAATQGVGIKLLMGAAGAGLIVSFLPAASVSVSMFGQTISKSVLVIGVWQGVLGLLCYLAAGVLAFFLARAEAANPNLTWAAVGVSVLVVLLALGLLVSVFNAGGAGAAPFGVQASVGFGAFLNLLAAAGVCAGAYLKAKEDRLF
jgi:hypothetical protein